MNALARIILLVFAFVFISCKDDDNSEVIAGNLTIQFKHDWNGKTIEFDDLKYENENGEMLSIHKLKYLISNIRLYKTDGSSFQINDYILVDLSSEPASISIPNIPFNNYSEISFTFGFDESDNIDGTYNDLNAASWNWPSMLGGGYHFMQFEGKYLNDGNESPFAYHMGTAKISDGVFEHNFFEVEFNGFNFTKPSTLNLTMNIAEWFKNPHTWDLNIYDINLMPKYEAQKMMNDNGKTVFSLGEID